MADMDGIKKNEHEGIDPLKNFHTDAAPGKTNYHIKGMDNMSWGMKDRMSRIFNPKSVNSCSGSRLYIRSYKRSGTSGPSASGASGGY